MIALQWRQPDPPLRLRWRGADGRLAPSALAVPVPPVPTLIGPPGIAGPPGPEGPPFDLSSAVIDGGIFT